MKNTLKLTLLFMITLLPLCFTSGKLSAQNINRDSLKRVAFSRDSIYRDSLADIDRTIYMANTDGRRLRLSPAQREKFNADKKNAGSDLFKPTLVTVSDTMKLRDSVYAKAFRTAAYQKALKYRKRTAGHYILVSGIVVVSAALVFVLTLGTLFSTGALKVGD